MGTAGACPCDAHTCAGLACPDHGRRAPGTRPALPETAARVARDALWALGLREPVAPVDRERLRRVREMLVRVAAGGLPAGGEG